MQISACQNVEIRWIKYELLAPNFERIFRLCFFINILYNLKRNQKLLKMEKHLTLEKILGTAAFLLIMTIAIKHVVEGMTFKGGPTIIRGLAFAFVSCYCLGLLCDVYETSGRENKIAQNLINVIVAIGAIMFIASTFF